MLSLYHLLISYFLGSIPFAYLLARLHSKDLTKFGDGNMGAANAYYATGKLWVGVVSTILDAFKAFLPAYLWGPWCGAVAVLAHIFSIFGFILAGRIVSGAGTAPAIGFALAVCPLLVPIAAAIFSIYYLILRPGGRLTDFFSSERGYTAGMVMLWATYAVSYRLGLISGTVADAVLFLVSAVSLVYAYRLRHVYKKWGILKKN